jgi:hypothetical protein
MGEVVLNADSAVLILGELENAPGALRRAENGVPEEV